MNIIQFNERNTRLHVPIICDLMEEEYTRYSYFIMLLLMSSGIIVWMSIICRLLHTFYQQCNSLQNAIIIQTNCMNTLWEKTCTVRMHTGLYKKSKRTFRNTVITQSNCISLKHYERNALS